MQETTLHLAHDDVIVHGRTHIKGGIRAQDLGNAGVGVHLHLDGLCAPCVGGIGIAAEFIQIEGNHKVRLDKTLLHDLILALLPLSTQLDGGTAQ